MKRSSAAKTEQQKALDNFSQLWLSAEEWDGPFEVLGSPDLVTGGPRRIAWIFQRIR
jgi:hypothetical protein